MNKRTQFLLTILLVVFAGIVFAQEDASADRTVIAFSDPMKPGLIEARVLNGKITVQGYEGKEVIVEAQSSGKVLRHGEKDLEHQQRELEHEGGEHESNEKTKRSTEGMRKLQSSGTGLKVYEKNNVIEIVTHTPTTVDINIKVPYSTSLHLKSELNGGIVVEKVRGEIEAKSLNGYIKLNGVTGSVVAETLNGAIEAFFDKVDSKKPYAFTSLNGDIDVTFPADVKANVQLKSQMGDIYTDFNITLSRRNEKKVEDRRGEGGELEIKIGEAMFGQINGGGIEMIFENFNGDIFIRKHK
ncbi:MAG: hypothetical protein A2Y62_22130 [Candidatus Fischerbacteria bacterium RBG_13_37_8]|uniref:DUF4097 domain-containing protein n=1 Tax=Candidatus Fischerbacteria bacterium RBG_13_37_8 TaxID=1817863 RepID=A0A1F5VX32_9BACT|nr:MAG: hypothetical protein A2Y62_22130 [Candidatus Fischerbacteria bacterium RBG_13_37_8]